MPDDLYQRYQTAARTHHTHCVECTHCTDAARCLEGVRLNESFERLQDAYLARQHTQVAR